MNYLVLIFLASNCLFSGLSCCWLWAAVYFMCNINYQCVQLKLVFFPVKNSVIRRELQAYGRGVWGLLPAFCRHPDDISQSFQSVAKLLLVRLEKDTSIHEDISVAVQVLVFPWCHMRFLCSLLSFLSIGLLVWSYKHVFVSISTMFLSVQELVKQNKCLPESADASEPRRLSSDSIEDCLMEKRSFYCYSMKMARKNIKALSSYSYELLQAIIIIFLNSSSEKRSSLRVCP